MVGVVVGAAAGLVVGLWGACRSVVVVVAGLPPLAVPGASAVGNPVGLVVTVVDG